MKHNSIFNGTHYKGLPIMEFKGPFYEADLEKIYAVTCKALTQHSKITAFRFDLHLPSDYYYVEIHRLMDRCIASLKSKLNHAQKKSQRESKSGYVHRTGFWYLWAREYKPGGREHYHFIFLLNGDAFKWNNSFLEGENMYTRVVEAWGSALGINSFNDVCGLVHVPSNSVYEISRNNPQSVSSFFHRASYLAKTCSGQVKLATGL